MKNFMLSSLVLLSTLSMVMPQYYDARSASSAYSNSRSSHTSYVKSADGRCYKQTVTIINGVKHVDNQPIDCAVADQAMKAQQEATQQKINQQFMAHQNFMHSQPSPQNFMNTPPSHQNFMNTQQGLWSPFRRGLGGFNFGF